MSEPGTNGIRHASERSDWEVQYGGNFERNVWLKGEPLDARATCRYTLASQLIQEGQSVLELGCSNGYGTDILPKNIKYLGIDYNHEIIGLANEIFADDNHTFQQADVNNWQIPFYDVIIAFEFLEHIPNGIEIAQELKAHCNMLLATVPYNEDSDFYPKETNHHVIHNLTEVHYPGFEYKYISFSGNVSESIDTSDTPTILFMIWKRGETCKK